MTPDLKDDLGRLEEAAGEGRPIHLHVTAGIEQTSCDVLQSMLALMQRLRVPRADLAMSSLGGSATCGVELHNILRATPVKVTAYNIGTVGSAATDMFVGVPRERRYAAPGSQFIIHGAEYETDDGESITVAKARNILASIEQDDATTIELITASTKITRRQIRSAFNLGRELAYGAAEAKKAGIVRAVKAYSIPKDAEIFLIQEKKDDEVAA